MSGLWVAVIWDLLSGEQLVDAGHDVVGIRRRSEQLPESFTRISADIASHDGWKNVPKQIDRWVYALAADDRSSEAYERAYELGTQRLVDHLGGEEIRSRHLCLQYQCV